MATLGQQSPIRVADSAFSGFEGSYRVGSGTPVLPDHPGNLWPAEFVSNPDFDADAARVYNLPGMPPLQRGFIILKEPIAYGNNPKQRYRLNFLYNPSTIVVQYDMGAPTTPEQYLDQAGQGVPSLFSGTQCQFTLVFDRTYEISRGSVPIGVLADIGALEHMLVNSLSGSPTLPLMYIIFGQSRGALYMAPKPFAFTGYIIGCTITYTKFAHNMVPQRAEVQLGATFISSAGGAITDTGGAPTGSTVDADGSVHTPNDSHLASAPGGDR